MINPFLYIIISDVLKCFYQKGEIKMFKSFIVRSSKTGEDLFAVSYITDKPEKLMVHIENDQKWIGIHEFISGILDTMPAEISYRCKDMMRKVRAYRIEENSLLCAMKFSDKLHRVIDVEGIVIKGNNIRLINNAEMKYPSLAHLIIASRSLFPEYKIEIPREGNISCSKVTETEESVIVTERELDDSSEWEFIECF